MKGIKNLLTKNGVFILEFPYIDFMLKNNYFDLIYHEHYSYLSIKPLNILFSNFDLSIFKIIKVDVGASGPALRVFVTQKNSKFDNKKDLKKYLNYEIKRKLNLKVTYINFNLKVSNLKTKILKLINKLIVTRKKVGCFGAPAKGNTLLNYLKLNNTKITAVSENNPIKIGKYTPGSQIPIISDKEFEKHGIDYALLLSWNYLKFFKKNANFYKKGGKFIVPFPKPKII